MVDGTGSAMAGLFEGQKTARDSFQKQLTELAEEVFDVAGRTPPIFILIDELDRCRPSYAVELLERIKHLFAIENLVFVLGSDTEKLLHSVRGLYGGEFDSKRYLKRFMDRTYTFLPIELAGFVEHTFAMNGLEEEMFTLPRKLPTVAFLQKMFSEKGIELRDIEQMMEMMEMMATFVSFWPWGKLEIDLIYLLPIIHQKHLNNPMDYSPPLLK